MYYLTVLEVKSLKRVSLGLNQNVDKAMFLSKGSRGKFTSLSFLVSRVWNLAGSCGAPGYRRLSLSLSLSPKVQFSCSLCRVQPLILCDPMDCSTPGFLVHHQLPKLAQTHVYRVGDVTQPSHPLSSPSTLWASWAQKHFFVLFPEPQRAGSNCLLGKGGDVQMRKEHSRNHSAALGTGSWIPLKGNTEQYI